MKRAAQYQCCYKVRSWQEEEGDWSWEETPAVAAITHQEEALQEARQQEQQGKRLLVERQLWQGDQLVSSHIVYQTPEEPTTKKAPAKELVPYFPFGQKGERAKLSFKGFWNIDGVCNLEIYREHHTVICTEISENEGTSITNLVEELAKKVCGLYGIDPAKLIWLERYTNETYGLSPESYQRENNLPVGVIEECSLVRFERTEGGDFKRPTWKHLSPEEVAHIKALLEN